MLIHSYTAINRSGNLKKKNKKLYKSNTYTVLLRNNLTENAFGTRPERVRKCVPFAFHLRSNLRSAFTGTHLGTRSCNTRNKNGCDRKLS